MKFRQGPELKIGNLYTATYNRPANEYGVPILHGIYIVKIRTLNQGKGFGKYIIGAQIIDGKNKGYELSFKKENFREI